MSSRIVGKHHITPPFAHLAQEMLDYLDPIEDHR
jgi:hypothetical protein